MRKKPAKSSPSTKPDYVFYLINLLRFPLYVKPTMDTMDDDGKTNPVTLIYFGTDEEQIKNIEPQLEYATVETEKDVIFHTSIAESKLVFVDTEDPVLSFSRIRFVNEENNTTIVIFKHESDAVTDSKDASPN